MLQEAPIILGFERRKKFSLCSRFFCFCVRHWKNTGGCQKNIIADARLASSIVVLLQFRSVVSISKDCSSRKKLFRIQVSAQKCQHHLEKRRGMQAHISTHKESERKRGARREILIPSALTTGVICHGVLYEEFTQMILRKDRGSFQIHGVLHQLASTTLFPCCFTLVDPQHPWQCSLNESVSPRNFFSQMSRVSHFKRAVTPLAYILSRRARLL